MLCWDVFGCAVLSSARVVQVILVCVVKEV